MRRQQVTRGIVAAAVLAVGMSGCAHSYRSTKINYVPEQIASEDTGKAPEYPEVRKWALAVADGYDTRRTSNRYSLYVGYTVAAAGAGALAGLAAFSPGSSAIIGIPIGTTFLSGVLAYFNSEPKAMIYDAGSRAVKDLVTLSDCRLKVNPAPEPCMAPPCPPEPVCLQRDVEMVMRRVAELISYLDPKNVTDTLRAVAASSEAKTAAAEQGAEGVTLLKQKIEALKKDIAKAKADKAKELEEKLTEALAKLEKELPEAEKKVAGLQAEAAKAKSLLNETLHATLVNSKDLETVRSTCGIPDSCRIVFNEVHGPNPEPEPPTQ